MKKFHLISGIFALVFILAAAWAAFEWLFCRFYVPPGSMAVVTAKDGRAPKPGTLLVERGEKGIWREVLGEGRHFLNPITHDIAIVPATLIPLGKVGIVTSKVGRELAPGEIIAPDASYKGVRRDVLGPGLYRLNPEGYRVEIVDAVTIPAGYAGIVTSQTGSAPRPGSFAKPGEKGVFRDILQPGLYYINRYAFQINVIEIGMNQVTMSGNNRGSSVIESRNRLQNASDALRELEQSTLNFQTELRRKQQLQRPPDSISSMRKRILKTGAALKSRRRNESNAQFARDAAPAVATAPPDAETIFGVSRAVEFPSRDGFKVTLDMTVEFELMPEHTAKIYLLYGDLPQVVRKIILPQVLSVSRLKGSSYRAQDFIMGDGREKFQLDLRRELVKALAAKNIVVHNAIIRNVEIPRDILKPIQAVSLAREQNLTNVSMQETAKKLAELNTETELIEQRRRQVGQETAKLVAQTVAEGRKVVASIRAEGELEVAQIRLKKSEILARTAKLRGEAAVKVKFLIANETARGELLKAAVLGPEALTGMTGVDALNSRVQTRLIHAGEGTLWTDLKAASIQLPGQK